MSESRSMKDYYEGPVADEIEVVLVALTELGAKPAVSMTDLAAADYLSAIKAQLAELKKGSN